MLPSGITTLLCPILADHPGLTVICLHGAVKFSSPKNQAQPEGLFADKSINETVRGAGPDAGMPVKLATGASAATSWIVIANRTRKKRNVPKSLPDIST
jgi:hypothetical protein